MLTSEPWVLGNHGNLTETQHGKTNSNHKGTSGSDFSSHTWYVIGNNTGVKSIF